MEREGKIESRTEREERNHDSRLSFEALAPKVCIEPGKKKPWRGGQSRPPRKPKAVTTEASAKRGEGEKKKNYGRERSRRFSTFLHARD